MKKMILAPKRFVQYPKRTQISEPNITGTAVTKAISLGESDISFFIWGIKDEMIAQTINPTTRLRD